MMNRIVIISFALSTLLTACSNKENNKGQQSLMEASKQELVEALEERDELLGLVKEISTSMDRIKHLENIMTLTGTQIGENPAQKAQILSDLAAVKQTLQQRREKLAELEAKLSKSSSYTTELKSTIEALRTQLDSQAEEIESMRKQLSDAKEKIEGLNHEVDSLNSTVATVNQNLDSAEAAFSRLENEMNTCFYVLASKSELKKHKIKY